MKPSESIASASSSNLSDDSTLRDETSTISTTLTTTSVNSDNSVDHDLDKLISERHSKITTTCHKDSEHDPEHHSKFTTWLGLLKKFIGVKDIVATRISLPAQLIEPIGNLEYWNYNDRPDYFVCIGDSDDPLERMLAAIRWWYSKDLKYVKGKLVKPYNSILGEQFFCYWDVTPPSLDDNGNLAASPGVATSDSQSKHRVTCINEQISHHPPISAFYYQCEEKGITACGVDHISARFTGTSVKIGPGDRNKGIYVRLEERDNEEYLMTHPVAAIQGWLKGSLYIVVGEACIITCPKTKLKAILEYKEERWLGKPRFAIEGKIFEYDPENDDIKKLKSVDEEAVLCEVHGSWKGEVHAKIRQTNETRLILNMEAIDPIPKTVKPIAEQGPLESRNVWQKVTAAILSKDYSQATKEKQSIEEKQRQKAAAAKAKKEEFEPSFFKLPVIDGQPELKDEGIRVLRQFTN